MLNFKRHNRGVILQGGISVFCHLGVHALYGFRCACAAAAEFSGNYM